MRLGKSVRKLRVNEIIWDDDADDTAPAGTESDQSAADAKPTGATPLRAAE